MSSLVFLLSRKVKNRFLEILHRPAELVMLVVFVLLAGVTVFSGQMSAAESGAGRDIGEFYALIFALYALIFVLVSKNGFHNGASMFSMADVNFLFTSPKTPNLVLIFGLFGQLGRSLLLGVFVLYQYSWLHSSYGVGMGDLLAVLVGYGVTVFLSQMLAMLIYSFTSSDERKYRTVKIIYYAVVAAFALYAVYTALRAGGELLPSLVKSINSSSLLFFPVAGFVKYGVVSAVTGSLKGVLVAVACFVFCLVLFFVFVSLFKSDYYEDVLKATEVSFSAVTASKEGKVAESAPRNVRLGKTGLKKGEGASAIAEKHKIENRRSRVFLLDAPSLVFAAITIVLAFFVKEIIVVFAMNVYFSVFTVGMGRFSKELLLPYVYLIPEPPFKKLLNVLREQLPSLLAEATVTFLPLLFLLKLSVLKTVGLIFAKFAFGILFVGVNLVLQRFFGSGGNKVLLIFLYFVLAALASAPGIALGSVFESFLPLFDGIAFFVMALVNTLVGALLVYLSRNVLEYSEYNNK